jgi:ABC-2 type transport system ATP-binding protein
MKNAVVVKNLQKSFGKLTVLKDVNFQIKTGEILALLGPNGAGKTTTINILSTLLQPDEGTAEVAGYDVVSKAHKVRATIGLTGQFAAVDEYLTGRENIHMIGRLYHMESSKIPSRVSELLEKFDLVDAADRPARTYSGGMKRRLDLAMSLVASPLVLFLDEPTTGLDPRSRIALWQMIKQLAKDGTSILLTTQYMEEAEFLANNVIVLDHGTIIAEGTVNELKAKAGSEQIEITLKNQSQMTKALTLLKGAKAADNDESSLQLPAKFGLTTLKSTIETLENAKIVIDTAAMRRPTLDDVFLALTGHAAEETKQENDTKKKKGAKK